MDVRMNATHKGWILEFRMEGPHTGRVRFFDFEVGLLGGEGFVNALAQRGKILVPHFVHQCRFLVFVRNAEYSKNDVSEEYMNGMNGFSKK